jgi:dTDP-4-amino-4,6-dideoxygalactose transaminase
MRGATPVFVDIRADTLNIDEAKIEAAISPRTKAIVPVHYAGVPCEMDYILRISQSYGFWVISDAAQALGSFYKGRDVLSIGHMSTVSFHETKNISSGEGGALIVNDARFLERASIAWEKGTNRKAFFEGLVDKYTWIDLGSSYLPSEVTAALLLIQLKNKDFILSERMRIWESYHSLFRDMEEKGLVRRPFIPEGCTHNAHMYYLLLRQEGVNRSEVLNRLKDDGIHAVFHYTPLHTSPAGIKYGRVSGDMINTDKLSSLLIRLPLWIGLSNSDAVYVRERVEHAILASML